MLSLRVKSFKPRPRKFTDQSPACRLFALEGIDIGFPNICDLLPQCNGHPKRQSKRQFDWQFRIRHRRNLICGPEDSLDNKK